MCLDSNHFIVTFMQLLTVGLQQEKTAKIDERKKEKVDIFSFYSMHNLYL